MMTRTNPRPACLASVEAEALDNAQAALGALIRTGRADLSVFCAFQDIYRARKGIDQPAVEAASREVG